MKPRLGRLLHRGAPPSPPEPSPAALLGLDPGDLVELDAAPPPVGWQSSPPDFVIVGAEGAGADLLAQLLAAHPQVHAMHPDSRCFERYYDSWPTDEELARYRGSFARPPGLRSGQHAPTTMSLYWAPRMLAAAAPEARLLMVLADPVARYVAGRARLEGYRGQAPAWGYGPRAFTRWSVERSFHRGEYALQLGWLQDAFPPDRILVIQQESLQLDTPVVMARVQRFLDLDAYPGVASVVRPGTDRTTVHIEPRQMAMLAMLYRHDIRRLAAMVPDLDLSLWPSASAARARAVSTPG